MTGSRPENILVIKLSALGDFMLALPSMAAIRKHHPQAHITLLTTRPFVDMAERSRYFDAIITDTRPRFYHLPAWLGIFRKLNGGNFTRVYDLQMNDRTRIYYRLFLKKPEWSGVIRGSALFYPNKNWRDMHAAERHKAVLKVAGIDVGAADTSWMQADVSLLQPKKPYILLVPGSAPTRPDKRWPAVKYGALGMKLMRQGYEVAVLGTQAESDVIGRVVRSCPGIHDLCGKTSLYDIATLARGAAGAVGNDTGPTHIIALSGCPTVALFSSASDPAQCAPVGDVAIIQADYLEDVQVDQVLELLKTRKVA